MLRRMVWSLVVLASLSLTGLTGCRERNLASPLPYDSEQVDLIRKTIHEIDWAELE